MLHELIPTVILLIFELESGVDYNYLMPGVTETMVTQFFELYFLLGEYSCALCPLYMVWIMTILIPESLWVKTF